jgi:hypothetical protein
MSKPAVMKTSLIASVTLSLRAAAAILSQWNGSFWLGQWTSESAKCYHATVNHGSENPKEFADRENRRIGTTPFEFANFIKLGSH